MEEIGTSVAFMQYCFKLHFVFFLHHQIERIQREVAMFCLELGCTQQFSIYDYKEISLRNLTALLYMHM